MANRNMSDDDIRQTVDWEGGPFEALDWGITYDDFADPNSKLALAWRDLEIAYTDMKGPLRRVEEALYE